MKCYITTKQYHDPASALNELVPVKIEHDELVHVSDHEHHREAWHATRLAEPCRVRVLLSARYEHDEIPAEWWALEKLDDVAGDLCDPVWIAHVIAWGVDSATKTTVLLYEVVRP